ncbi:MAG: outer membrane lipoprotein-sorting protein [bacterium]|nr:outer membrane lipoprotein-sorting protein [bacterium]
MECFRTPEIIVGLFLSLCLAAGPTSAEPLKSLEDVDACIHANIPKKTSVQTIEFVTRDKLAFERTTRGKIYARRADDSLRQILMIFTRPQDLRGTQYLMLEAKDHVPDMYIYTRELRKAKRITGRSASGSMFGTDFSFEDFQRMQLLNQPGSSKLLENTVVMDRPAYVIETKPDPSEKSSYEAITAYWDQETCVALKTESYERGHRLRKVLTCDPEQIQQHENIWACQSVLMEDIRDATQTRLLIETMEVGIPIKNRTFSVTGLGKNVR